MSETYGIRGDPDYTPLGSDVLCAGKYVQVVEERFRLPNGANGCHEVVHLPEAVAIVPIDVDEHGEVFVVLIEQFRNAVRGHMHELPAGIVEEGEELSVCAGRELSEETGFVAGRIEHLASLLTIPGASSQRLHFFLAEELTPGPQQLEPTECVRVRRVPFGPLVKRLVGESPGSTPVVDTKTHLGLLHCSLLLERRALGDAP